MIPSSDTTFRATEIIQAELASGESILWIGRPSPRVIFHRSDWLAIPYILVWYWVTLAHEEARESRDLMWWLCMAIGQYLLWGRLVYAAWDKTRTWYAVTSKRVLVVRTGRTRKRVDGFFGPFLAASLDQRSPRFGSIEFSPDPTYDAYSFRHKMSSRMDLDLNRLAFYDIPDAREVYKLIRERREKALKA